MELIFLVIKSLLVWRGGRVEPTSCYKLRSRNISSDKYYRVTLPLPFPYPSAPDPADKVGWNYQHNGLLVSTLVSKSNVNRYDCDTSDPLNV